ncbi:MAG: MFS transporter [Intrasporangium sp.]|uniref:MFS transporter n=1 Tax=Intrasporangium sp. TaxID=1925024 RepID=UPI0026495427|nr:MFS transporter [Intrasporangium sp.]MDN5795410.1 MFS transporter [Intrasporangium sp.]
MRQAFAIPAFRRLFVALAATMVADSVLLLSFGIMTKELTGSSGAAGMAIFWVVAPSLVAPLLGWVVDQFPRRRFLIGAYPFAAASLIPLAWVHDARHVWIVYAVAFAYGVALVMLPGAVIGLLKLIVPEEQLVHANAASSTFREGLRLFGPLLGASMYAVWGMDSVIVLVAVGYAVAIVAVAGLRVPEDVVTPPELHWRHEFVAGLTHVYRDKLLWWPILTIGGCIFAFGFLESLVYAITDAFDRPATFVGVIVSVQGIGALAGGLLSGRIIERIGHVRAIVVSIGLFAIALAIMALAPSLPIVIAGAVPLGFGLPVLIVAINTLVQIRTPNRLMARVSTTLDAMIGTPQIVSIAIGAGLVALVDYRILLGAMSVLVGALCLALAAWSRHHEGQHSHEVPYAAGPAERHTLPRALPQVTAAGATGPRSSAPSRRSGTSATPRSAGARSRASAPPSSPRCSRRSR